MQDGLKQWGIAPLLRVVVPHRDGTRAEATIASVHDITNQAEADEEDSDVEEEDEHRVVGEQTTENVVAKRLGLQTDSESSAW